MQTAGWILIPLRLFLGVTFVFAGLQKLADPQFLSDNSPTSIHAQLLGAERSSPIHGLLAGLVHIAPAVGLVIAIGEVAVGLGVLVGLWTRIAALGGMAISLGLFLTVSYNSSPYFTGSDIVFFFAWTPLLIAGAGGAPALDTYLGRLRPGSKGALSEGSLSAGEGMDRRALLSRGATTGVLAAVVLATGGLVAWIGRLAGGTTAVANSATGTATIPSDPQNPTTSSAPSTTPTTAGAPTTTAPVPAGHRLAPTTDVPVGGAAQFTDPATGGPGLVLQPTADTFVAFSAICPHAGCTVAFARSSDIIACPCHGSEFNARTGAVEHGPATRGLTHIPVTAAGGELYVDR